MRIKIKSIAQNLCFPPISKQVPLHEVIDRTLTSQIVQFSIKNISKIYQKYIFIVAWDSASTGLLVINSPTKIIISNFHIENNKIFNKINH